MNQAAAGANDGTSWEDAYTDLSDALLFSSEGDQIWVAAGRYLPGGATPTRDTFFRFPHDLELYGGFAGTEMTIEERDIAANETILSGDLAGDDIDDTFTSNRTDNVRHVLWLTDTITNASIIDGFTIRNGHTENADGAGNDRRGGAILTYGNPTIRNCSFTQNYGYFGGALYPRLTERIVIESCSFTNNFGSWGGSGIYINSDSASVNNCTFANNISETRRGAGLASFLCNIVVNNCTFSENSSSASSGGAMHIGGEDDEDSFEAFVTNCTFTNNDGIFGGALACYGEDLTVNIDNCVFTTNEAENVGGAITNAFGVITNISNCTFDGNISNGSGGAVYSQNDRNIITIVDTEMLNNEADFGGAISMSGDNEAFVGAPLPILNLDRVSISLNVAETQGGGINLTNGNLNMSNGLLFFNSVNAVDGVGGGISLNTSDTLEATFHITNSTIASNIASVGAGISNWKPEELSTSVLTMQNTILDNQSVGLNYFIEAGNPEFVSDGGNLSSDASMLTQLTGTNDLNEMDPLFVSPFGLDYRLQITSPCIDQGIAEGAPPTDIEGNPRINEPDMGAFENQMVVNVDEELKEFGKLSLFPNPAVDVLHINFSTVWQGNLRLQVYSASGQLVWQKTLVKDSVDIQEALDVSPLPSGSYQLSISNGRLSNGQLFVKQ